MGGKLHGFWYGFGTDDGYNLWEAPDNASMAAVALAITGGGALISFERTRALHLSMRTPSPREEAGAPLTPPLEGSLARAQREIATQRKKPIAQLVPG